ncbi:MAG: hypothetical protein IPN18_08105 [Ignavibacteriales bacterium]|nr:hypothetical protein [Ignavibacteriales bacterium]
MKIDVDPVFTSSRMWEKAIPQYNLGYNLHEDYFAKLNSKIGLVLSGNTALASPSATALEFKTRRRKDIEFNLNCPIFELYYNLNKTNMDSILQTSFAPHRELTPRFCSLKLKLNHTLKLQEFLTPFLNL